MRVGLRQGMVAETNVAGNWLRRFNFRVRDESFNVFVGLRIGT